MCEKLKEFERKSLTEIEKFLSVRHNKGFRAARAARILEKYLQGYKMTAIAVEENLSVSRISKLIGDIKSKICK